MLKIIIVMMLLISCSKPATHYKTPKRKTNKPAYTVFYAGKKYHTNQSGLIKFFKILEANKK